MLAKNSHKTPAFAQIQFFQYVFEACGVLNVGKNKTIIKNLHIFFPPGVMLVYRERDNKSRRTENLISVNKIK